MNFKAFYISFITLLFFSACQRDLPVTADNSPYYPDIPSYVPEMPVPEANTLTEARVRLGAFLFFDTRLSKDLSISCASCHDPAKAFSDQKSLSAGVNGLLGKRNSPTLFNLGFAPDLLWDGGSFSLEAQALVPIQNHREMDMRLAEIAERLSSDRHFTEMARAAYGDERYESVILKALASYERSLISFDTRFDDYYYRGKKAALSAEEKAGLELFFSEKTQCAACHTPPLFTDYSYRDNGLYNNYPDSGRGRITLAPEDLGKFKVPTLRNIALTFPYMHDGSLADLEEVLTHYNAGGNGSLNQSPLIRPLKLSVEEQKALISFLKTLSDKRYEK